MMKHINVLETVGQDRSACLPPAQQCVLSAWGQISMCFLPRGRSCLWRCKARTFPVSFPTKSPKTELSWPSLAKLDEDISRSSAIITHVQYPTPRIISPLSAGRFFTTSCLHARWMGGVGHKIKRPEKIFVRRDNSSILMSKSGQIPCSDPHKPVLWSDNQLWDWCGRS